MKTRVLKGLEETSPLKTVVFGYHLMGCLGLEALVRHGFEVEALFTHCDEKAALAKGEVIWWPSTAETAVDLGIPVRYVDEVSPRLLAAVAGYEPEILFSFYYRDLLPRRVLDLAAHGGFNLHGSLLPDGRGRSPVNWTLVRGLSRTGVTLHRMVERADAGDIVDQEAVEVDRCDNAYSLFQKLAAAAESLLHRSLPILRSGDCEGQPMDLSEGSYFGGRTPEDGALDWNRPASALYNLIRAVTHPYPGAFTHFGDRRLFVWWAFPLEEDLPGFDPGRVTRIGIEGIDIATGNGLLRITTVQLEGDPEMPASSFAVQHGVTAGKRLEAPHATTNACRSVR